MLDPDLMNEIKLLSIDDGEYLWYDPYTKVNIALKITSLDYQLKWPTVEAGSALATTIDNLSQLLVRDGLPCIDAANDLRVGDKTFRAQIVVSKEYIEIGSTESTESTERTGYAESTESKEAKLSEDDVKPITIAADGGDAGIERSTIAKDESAKQTAVRTRRGRKARI